MKLNKKFDVNFGRIAVPIIVLMQWQIHIFGFFMDRNDKLISVFFFIFLIGTGLAISGMIYFATEATKSIRNGATKHTRLMAVVYGVILLFSTFFFFSCCY